MHVTEIRQALDGMQMIVDTREQDTARLRRRIQQFGCPVERQALIAGDYSARFPLPGGEWFDMSDKVSIERKMSVDELCNCFTRERKRFEREFERAKEKGMRIYLLVENASWELMYAQNYKSKMTPQALISSLLVWGIRYDCHYIFCREFTSGKLIKDILYREGKERLERIADT